MTTLLSVARDRARVHWAQTARTTACDLSLAKIKRGQSIVVAVDLAGLERVALLDCEVCGRVLCRAMLAQVMRLRATGHRVATFEDSIELCRRRAET